MKKLLVIVSILVSMFTIIGCQKDEPTIKLKFDSIQSTNATHHGWKDGSITIKLKSGNPHFRYRVNSYFAPNGNDSSIISKYKDVKFDKLPADKYLVTVFDDVGQEIYDTVNITQPEELDILFLDIQNVYCYGGTSGCIEVTAKGESGNYLYSIDGVNFYETGKFIGLYAGTYTITIKSGDITTTKVVNITEPSQLTLNYTSTNPSTVGGNGQIILTAGGGNTPYHYDLNYGTSQTDNIFSVPAGTYTGRVIDSHGCATIKSNIVLYDPVSPTVTTNDATSITDNGAVLNGSVNPNNNTTTSLYFEYGLTSSYGTVINLNNVNSLTNVSSTLTDLTPGTTYHYRLVATNVGGTTNGDDKTFTTSITYHIGDELYGGVVYFVDGTGKHGLVVQKTNYRDQLVFNGLAALNLPVTINGKSWNLPSNPYDNTRSYEILQLLSINPSLNTINSSYTPIFSDCWTKDAWYVMKPGVNVILDSSSSPHQSNTAINNVRLITSF